MLTPIVKNLVEGRIQNLETSIEFQTRHINFKAERLDDYKTLIAADVREVVELKSFLSTLAAVTEPPDRNCITLLNGKCIGNNCMHHQPQETRRGLADPDGE